MRHPVGGKGRLNFIIDIGYAVSIVIAIESEKTIIAVISWIRNRILYTTCPPYNYWLRALSNEI